MFFHHHSMEKIQELIQKNEFFKNSFENIKDRVEAVNINEIVKEVQKRHEGEMDFNRSRDVGRFLNSLAGLTYLTAFYYTVTKDVEALNKTKELIHLFCKLSGWNYQLKKNRSDLVNADIGVSIALSYSIIQKELKENEKQLIQESLYQKAFKPLFEEWVDPCSRIHALDTMGHNWWAVCVSGAGVVLLALKDYVEDYERYLDLIASGLTEWIHYPGNVLQNKKGNFGEAGDYIEYIGYLKYPLVNLTIFDEMYRIHTNGKNILHDELAAKIPDFILSFFEVTENRKKFFDFGDNSSNQVTGMHTFLYLSNRSKRADLLECYHQMQDLALEPLEFYFYPLDISQFSNKQLDSSKVFNHAGYAVMRNGEKENQAVFAMKTGESWNHNHRDVGSFIINAKGIQYIVDSGTCSYSKPMLGDYYRAPIAHNIILKDGQGQRPEVVYLGTKYQGNFPVFFDSPRYKYLLADCTGPYCDLYQRFYRHVLWIDQYILMVDDVSAYSDGNLEWLLHIKGDLKLGEETIRLTHHDQPMNIYNLFPLKKEYSIETGYLSEIKKDLDDPGITPEASFVKINTSSVNCRMKFVNLFVLPYEENEGVKIEKTEFEAVQKISIQKRDGLTQHILINHRADGRTMHENSIIHFHDIETDALIVFYEMDCVGAIQRISMHNGSYIKIHGQTYLSSLIKIDALIQYTNEKKLVCHVGADTRLHYKNNSNKNHEFLNNLSEIQLEKGLNTLSI